WHHRWVEWQAIHPKYFRFNRDPEALMPWEVEELGIERFPTTVLASKRENTGREWADPLAALAFQREALRIAPELGQSMAYPLSRYGTLLLTSAGTKSSPARAMGELTERASRFAGRMARHFGCRVWVGMGSTNPGGKALRRSYHEAVAALHLAIARDQAMVRFQDVQGADQEGLGLRGEVEVLARALLEQGRSEMKRHATAFIQSVLVRTLGRPEASRRAFMELLNRLLGALETRRGLDVANLERFESDLVLKMETALDLNEMVARFETALAQLLSFLERPASGDKYFRLDNARQAVEVALNENWTLTTVTRQFGFSVSTFSREFSRRVGLPFSAFLLSKRLEKAKRMLSEGRSLEQISEACGFKSVNYFIQIFKRKVGMPPGKFGRLGSV
ncbi:MAG: helix-turn-helix domain-containing protein, partial [bacterium]